MSILTTREVVKQFEGHLALDKVSIEVPKGTIFGLLGPNGAGKTTLLRIVNQITAPDTGTVEFDGQPLAPSHIFQIGYLPEERGLYKKMKLGEQALYLAKLRGMSQAEATASLKYWFARFGIQSWWNKTVTELSKGMAQKMQFITTVMHNPKLLILDEPFSGFDPVNVEIIRNEILRLRDQGTSVILSTHNMESVEELCESIALINKARVIAAGKVMDIRRQYGAKHVEVCYQAPRPYAPADASRLPFAILEQGEQASFHRLVIRLHEGATVNQALEVLLPEVSISRVQEVIPRMNDIFIKLVTSKEAQA